MTREKIEAELKRAQEQYTESVNRLAALQSEVQQWSGAIQAYQNVLALMEPEEVTDGVERTSANG